jgi:hypothetical protein
LGGAGEEGGVRVGGRAGGDREGEGVAFFVDGLVGLDWEGRKEEGKENGSSAILSELKGDNEKERREGSRRETAAALQLAEANFVQLAWQIIRQHSHMLALFFSGWVQILQVMTEQTRREDGVNYQLKRS